MHCRLWAYKKRACKISIGLNPKMADLQKSCCQQLGLYSSIHSLQSQRGLLLQVKWHSKGWKLRQPPGMVGMAGMEQAATTSTNAAPGGVGPRMVEQPIRRFDSPKQMASSCLLRVVPTCAPSSCYLRSWLGCYCFPHRNSSCLSLLHLHLLLLLWPQIHKKHKHKYYKYTNTNAQI